jgi:hypothetical protein
MSTATKALTIRLPLDLYQTTSNIAERRQISLNALIQEALGALSAAEEEARLYEEFNLLGEDSEECDVEFAIHAAWEVIRREDP